MAVLAEIGSSLLLFCLVYGMSATVDISSMRRQVGNWRALLIGVSLQFVILPFCGFCVVKILNLPAVTGITLMVITSSPGGSYSNWWCSMFNAELALSVTMTGISTFLSILLLPMNLLLYTRWTYSSDVVQSLDWGALIFSLLVVISGIGSGLVSSYWAKQKGETESFRRKANLVGNLAGLMLITLSATVSSSQHQAALWDQSWKFYCGVAVPPLMGLAIATWLSSKIRLDKPERVAVAVEACYQNTGIATSVAITMFANSEVDVANAIGVPLYYGIVEAVALAIYCLVCWKLGWTKAPANENICKIIYTSYEVGDPKTKPEDESIEVICGGNPQDDVIVNFGTNEGYVIDNERLKHRGKEPEHDDVTESTEVDLPVEPIEATLPNTSNSQGTVSLMKPTALQDMPDNGKRRSKGPRRILSLGQIYHAPEQCPIDEESPRKLAQTVTSAKGPGSPMESLPVNGTSLS